MTKQFLRVDKLTVIFHGAEIPSSLGSSDPVEERIEAIEGRLDKEGSLFSAFRKVDMPEDIEGVCMLGGVVSVPLRRDDRSDCTFEVVVDIEVDEREAADEEA